MAKHDATTRTNPISPSQAQAIPNLPTGNTIAVDSSPEVRRGAYAEISTVKTAGTMSTIDFAMVEGPIDDQGTLGAILTSRVVMTNDNLIALRDMLVDHTKNW